MIAHHPDDPLLLSFASGTLQSGPALLLAVHAEACPHCRRRLAEFEALGGAMLESLDPELLAPQALGRTLARIDAEPAEPAVIPRGGGVAQPGIAAVLPGGLPWPSSMHGCGIGRWRWLGPGMRWSRVSLPHDRAANVFLLRIAAGKYLPPHTHSECELTQVLCGSFHDGRALFGPGDFDAAGGSIHHQPVVEPSGECVCLASVQGRVLFDSRAARILGALVGM